MSEPRGSHTAVAKDAARSGQVLSSREQLNSDLAMRLNAIHEEEAAGVDHFMSARPAIIEGLMWVALGACIWLASILVWHS